MSRKRYSDEEKIQIIKEAKESNNISATAKKYSIGDSSIHDWIKKFGDNKSTPEKKLKLENKKLKAQLADAQLENSILKDLVKKTVQVWSHEDQRLMNTSPKNLQKLKY